MPFNVRENSGLETGSTGGTCGKSKQSCQVSGLTLWAKLWESETGNRLEAVRT